DALLQPDEAEALRPGFRPGLGSPGLVFFTRFHRTISCRVEGSVPSSASLHSEKALGCMAVAQPAGALQHAAVVRPVAPLIRGNPFLQLGEAETLWPGLLLRLGWPGLVFSAWFHGKTPLGKEAPPW